MSRRPFNVEIWNSHYPCPPLQSWFWFQSSMEYPGLVLTWQHWRARAGQCCSLGKYSEFNHSPTLKGIAPASVCAYRNCFKLILLRVVRLKHTLSNKQSRGMCTNTWQIQVNMLLKFVGSRCTLQYYRDTAVMHSLLGTPDGPPQGGQGANGQGGQGMLHKVWDKQCVRACICNFLWYVHARTLHCYQKTRWLQTGGRGNRDRSRNQVSQNHVRQGVRHDRGVRRGRGGQERGWGGSLKQIVQKCWKIHHDLARSCSVVVVY